MKNDECTIYLILKGGKKQIWKKEKDGWTEISTRGVIRRGKTAEQAMSHLLPALAFKHVTVKVVPKKK